MAPKRQARPRTTGAATIKQDGGPAAPTRKKNDAAARTRKAAARTATMHVRLDPTLKVQAEAILDELGLTPSEAIRLFYARVRAYGGLPFELRVPNAETRAALADADAGVGLARYGSVDEMFADLGS